MVFIWGSLVGKDVHDIADSGTPHVVQYSHKQLGTDGDVNCYQTNDSIKQGCRCGHLARELRTCQICEENATYPHHQGGQRAGNICAN